MNRIFFSSLPLRICKSIIYKNVKLWSVLKFCKQTFKIHEVVKYILWRYILKAGFIRFWICINSNTVFFCEVIYMYILYLLYFLKVLFIYSFKFCTCVLCIYICVLFIEKKWNDISYNYVTDASEKFLKVTDYFKAIQI